ncbi:hypothetical protein A3E04_03340 [Candidatus Kuenenbacteria bacterium RIFCSPHIGHO2_12_FULL_42_14]|uniref:DUF11 domain-containing protein n=1 Tax=Candidatus Kuenenbacteria bacterium RIFCSPHIGHO2_12_FULL_42_14 TaxID=1798563 RepID=A0A1F6GKJ4_9BACT|nr:MAG: hypothetical protein A3E04_03340 [Candidatus Kuenenbacteria bacterium RIFCSPHIGHO2_12_FULL_42_14]
MTGWLVKKWQYAGLVLVAILTSLSIVGPVLAADTISVNMLGADLEVCNKDRIILHPDWGCGPTRQIGTVEVQTPGYYRPQTLSSFDSGNTQFNESYYLTIKNSDGQWQKPKSGNAGDYYVVEDWDKGNADPVYSDDEAGVYYFDDGVNEIYINHYSLIADSQPQFKNGPFQTNNESVSIASMFLTLYQPNCGHSPKIALAKIGPDYAEPGEEITYQLNWSVADNAVTDLVLTDPIPAKTTFVSATDGGVYNASTKTVSWNLGDHAAGDLGSVSLAVKVDGYIYDTDFIVNTATLDSNETASVAASKSTEMDAHCVLVIKKTGNKNPVQPSEEITYTIEYENIGDGICVGTGIMLAEYFDEQTTFVSSTPEEPHYHSYDLPYDPMPDDLGQPDALWQWTELIPDGPHSMEITVAVDDQAENGDVLTNQVCVWAENGGKVCTTEETTVYVPPTPYFNLNINKTAPATVIAGQEMTYQINWSITGNMTADDVVVTDYLPCGVDFVSADIGNPNGGGGGMGPGVPFACGFVSWNLGDIAPDASGTINLTALVNDGHQADTILANRVVIASGNQTSEDSVETTVVAPFSYNVNIEKNTNKNTAQAGEEVIYTLNWSVTGDMLAQNVVVSDTLPVEVSLVSATFGYTLNGQILTWNLGDQQPPQQGQMEVTVKINSLPTTGSQIVNNATIKSGDKTDTAEATVAVQDYNLTIVKTAPAEANPGDEITYAIEWGVNGGAIAPSVAITDTLPQGVNLLNVVGQVSGTYSLNGNAVVFSLGDITPNATGTIELLVKISNSLNSGDVLVNNVMMASGNKTASASATTTIVGLNDYALSLDKSAPAEVQAGENIKFNLAWSVLGNKTAQNVVLTDTLPSNVTFVSAAGSFNYNTTTRQIVWQLGDILPTASSTLEVIVATSGSANNGDQVINNAAITSGTKSASDSTTTTITKGGGGGADHNVFITKTAPTGINAGETITYGLNWNVTGNEIAPDVIITDTLPAKVIFVSATGNYTFATSTREIIWSLGNKNNGDNGSLNITVATNAADLSNGEQLVNNVIIRSGVKTDTATAATTVSKGGGGEPKFSVDLTYSFAQTKFLGNKYQESVTIKNTGDAPLVNGTMVIDIPAGVIGFVSALPDYASYNPITETATWQISALAVGQEKTFEFIVAAKASGTPKTGVSVVFDRASKAVDWTETVSEKITPEKPVTVEPAKPKQSVIVAPAATTTVVMNPAENICQVCEASDEDKCANCTVWLWFVIILTQLGALLVYYFFESKEEMKQDENGEYYIIKGHSGWMLPVFLALIIAFLLLYLVCSVASWWALALILMCYYLALVANHWLIKKAELKYGPILPILITLAVLVVYLICHSWYWWVLAAVIVFYVLTVGAYYFMVIKMNRQSRSYWWLAPLFATALTIVLGMILRMCSCGEVIG